MDGAERERQVRRLVDEVWNARNYDAAADLYHENYVNPFGTGPSARAEPIRRYHQAFPDLHLEVEELIVAGDAVVLRNQTGSSASCPLRLDRTGRREQRRSVKGVVGRAG